MSLSVTLETASDFFNQWTVSAQLHLVMVKQPIGKLLATQGEQTPLP